MRQRPRDVATFSAAGPQEQISALTRKLKEAQHEPPSPRTGTIIGSILSNRAPPFRSGSVRIGPHIIYMALMFPPKYELTTRSSTIHVGRYRWVITGNGKPVQTSLRSFETPAMAYADGDVTLEKLIRSSMIGQRAQRFRRAKKI